MDWLNNSSIPDNVALNSESVVFTPVEFLGHGDGAHISHKFWGNEVTLTSGGWCSHVSHEFWWDEVTGSSSWGSHISHEFWGNEIFSWDLWGGDGSLLLFLLRNDVLNWNWLVDWGFSLGISKSIGLFLFFLLLLEILGGFTLLGGILGLLLGGGSDEAGFLGGLLLDDFSWVLSDLLIDIFLEVKLIFTDLTSGDLTQIISLIFSVNEEPSSNCLLSGLDRSSSLNGFLGLIIGVGKGVFDVLGLLLFFIGLWVGHLRSNNSFGSGDGFVGVGNGDLLILKIGSWDSSLVVLELLLGGEITSLGLLWSEGTVDWVGGGPCLNKGNTWDWARDWDVNIFDELNEVSVLHGGVHSSGLLERILILEIKLVVHLSRLLIKISINGQFGGVDLLGFGDALLGNNFFIFLISFHELDEGVVNNSVFSLTVSDGSSITNEGKDCKTDSGFSKHIYFDFCIINYITGL